jgi:putrescine aminotransferase
MMGFIKLDQINNLSNRKLNMLYKNYFSDSLYKIFKLSGFDNHFVKAKGMKVWDDCGDEFLDFSGGYGTLNIGHNNERVLNALNEFRDYPNILQQSINVFNGVLSNNLCYLTKGNFSHFHFTSTGAETVEEALKTAMMVNKEGAIVYFSKAYHGKTLGAISCLGNKIKDNYNVFEDNFIECTFNDFEELQSIVEENDVSAILIEPIQGEGGINVPKEDFLQKVRCLCDEKEILLIFDEIQTGLGRCGSMFCYELYNVVPDMLCLSKSLSGGIVPIGCLAMKQELWDRTYGKLKNATLLSSTFGGNTFASIAAIEALSIIMEEKLPERAFELGEYTLKKLQGLKEKHRLIKEVRGKGLFIGIEFNLSLLSYGTTAEFLMSTIIGEMLHKYGIICGFTENNPAVLRVEPPLIVEKHHIDYFVHCLDKVLEKNNHICKLAKSALCGIVKNSLKI